MTSKDYMKDYLTDFINGTAKPYFDHSLIDETLHFLDQHPEVEIGHKAHRIYVKALMRKKIALANRIKEKYGHLFPKPDDTTIAAGFALMIASKRK